MWPIIFLIVLYLLTKLPFRINPWWSLVSLIILWPPFASTFFNTLADFFWDIHYYFNNLSKAQGDEFCERVSVHALLCLLILGLTGWIIHAHGTGALRAGLSAAFWYGVCVAKRGLWYACGKLHQYGGIVVGLVIARFSHDTKKPEESEKSQYWKSLYLGEKSANERLLEEGEKTSRIAECMRLHIIRLQDEMADTGYGLPKSCFNIRPENIKEDDIPMSCQNWEGMMAAKAQKNRAMELLEHKQKETKQAKKETENERSLRIQNMARAERAEKLIDQMKAVHTQEIKKLKTQQKEMSEMLRKKEGELEDAEARCVRGANNVKPMQQEMNAMRDELEEFRPGKSLDKLSPQVESLKKYLATSRKMVEKEREARNNAEQARRVTEEKILKYEAAVVAEREAKNVAEKMAAEQDATLAAEKAKVKAEKSKLLTEKTKTQKLEIDLKEARRAKEEADQETGHLQAQITSHRCHQTLLPTQASEAQIEAALEARRQQWMLEAQQAQEMAVQAAKAEAQQLQEQTLDAQRRAAQSVKERAVAKGFEEGGESVKKEAEKLFEQKEQELQAARTEIERLARQLAEGCGEQEGSGPTKAQLVQEVMDGERKKEHLMQELHQSKANLNMLAQQMERAKAASTGDGMSSAQESQMSLQLEANEKEIRELKERLVQEEQHTQAEFREKNKYQQELRHVQSELTEKSVLVADAEGDLEKALAEAEREHEREINSRINRIKSEYGGMKDFDVVSALRSECEEKQGVILGLEKSNTKLLKKLGEVEGKELEGTPGVKRAIAPLRQRRVG